MAQAPLPQDFRPIRVVHELSKLFWSRAAAGRILGFTRLNYWRTQGYTPAQLTTIYFSMEEHIKACTQFNEELRLNIKRVFKKKGYKFPPETDL